MKVLKSSLIPNFNHIIAIKGQVMTILGKLQPYQGKLRQGHSNKVPL